MWAYIDSERYVLATSTEERTIEQAQSKIPEITARVENAPDTITAKGMGVVEYHRLKEGTTGTSIDDYDVVEFLDDYKTAKEIAIDDRTAELMLGGFRYVKEDPAIDVEFSTSIPAQINWASLAAWVDTALKAGLTEEQIFPMKMPTRPLDGGNWECPSLALYYDVCVQMGIVRSGYVTAGQDLKNAVKAATTKAEVDAITDPRV